MSASDDVLLRVLRESFGFAEFRGPQRAAIECVLAGCDALAVMPTGSGKSLLYQVPALGLERPVLVLSPLIALMKDQVDALKRRGIAATFVNSSIPRDERERRLSEFAAGRIRLLYVTPERFRSESFLATIDTLNVGLLAVDEAHCVSQWGHDFRPDYSRLEQIRRRLKNPPTLAVTATATPRVQDEIVRLLGIPDAHRFHAGIERANLFFSARVAIDEDEKLEMLRARLQEIGGSTIVYGALIRDLERLIDRLGRAAQAFVLYHGDLPRNERRRVQDRFMSGEARVVLATNAFGLGIDKADIRAILHWQTPGSVEALYQEQGRAGRDGQSSFCELLYCEQDLAIQAQFIDWANPDRAMLLAVARILEEWGGDVLHFELADLKDRVHARQGHDGRVETCLQWMLVLGVLEGSFEGRDLKMLRPLDPAEIPPTFSAAKKKSDLQRLWSMVEYVKSPECRRRFLYRYFGLEEPTEPCLRCDRCVGPPIPAREQTPFDASPQ